MQSNGGADKELVQWTCPYGIGCSIDIGCTGKAKQAEDLKYKFKDEDVVHPFKK